MGSLIFDASSHDVTVEKDYTFKDVKVDFEIDVKNREIADNKDVIAIEGGIFNMFLFDQGERIIQPEFGNSIYKYLYEPINKFTAENIINEIRLMFERWEPRVNILDITAEPFEDENTIYIKVFYNVPALGDAVLTFEASINARR